MTFSLNQKEDVRAFGDISDVEEPADFQVYSIRDIFFLTTLTAVLVICVIPFNGLVSSAALFLWVILVLAEVSFLAILIRYLSKRRRRILQHSGAKWGIGLVSELQWAAWPHVKTWLSLIAIATLAVCLNLFATWTVNCAATGSVPLIGLLSALQVLATIPLYVYMFAKLICGAWCRVYPNTIEFFENGICYNFARWYQWSEVEVRQSAIYRDRIVVLFIPLPPVNWQRLEKQVPALPRQQHVIRLGTDLKSRILQARSKPDGD